ncbi:hypothetical protein PANT111_160214 [Pantoea brenneri]|uniref:Uncharacterized protein n=1 Tax=Pantoea brenneri TaxID=472694 RepID=A0AAX3J4P1_9GAMM|nr:hypothetical protein PANT111_160214 [Pantoea brenneri]
MPRRLTLLCESTAVILLVWMALANELSGDSWCGKPAERQIGAIVNGLLCNSHGGNDGKSD